MRSPTTGQIGFEKLNKGLWEAAQDRLDEAADKSPAIHNIVDGFSDSREDFKGYYNLVPILDGVIQMGGQGHSGW